MNELLWFVLGFVLASITDYLVIRYKVKKAERANAKAYAELEAVMKANGQIMPGSPADKDFAVWEDRDHV